MFLQLFKNAGDIAGEEIDCWDHENDRMAPI
jgi:hypothetical protein